jgi:hypothetical protein
MKNGVNWIGSKCVASVLIALSEKPLTPMQLRVRTGMTKNNYVNIILARLEAGKIVKCLNPKERIGKLFCINPVYAMVGNVLGDKGFDQKTKPLPNLNWAAYGRLQCPNCTQLRNVFAKANQLRLEGRFITPYTIMERLPDMATSDVHRALKRLTHLNLLVECKEESKRFLFSSDGLKIIEFDPEILI